MFSQSALRNLFVRTLFILASVLFSLSAAFAGEPPAPRVYFLDGTTLAKLRDEVAHQKQTDLRKQVIKLGDKAMKAGPWSVTEKDRVAPSGDKHDYLSMAPYFWPDPKSPNGLPYIRRDGERNPEAAKIPDRDYILPLFDTTYTLSVAYYLTGDQKYADRAELLLRTWFLDPATRMNPNMNYAQYIAGLNDGRGAGLIETRGMSKLVDSLALLSISKSWTTADQDGMKQWISSYFDWLQNSNNGRHEAKAPNNHGAWYEQQLAAIALFLGKDSFAKDVLRDRVMKRIANQVQPDGHQPYELERTKALHYSTFNLRALLNLQRMGDATGVDLWNYSTPDGRSTRKALDYLLPYVSGEKKWEYQQIVDYEYDGLEPLLLWSALKYNDARYEKLALKLVPSTDDIDSLVLRAAWSAQNAAAKN